MSCPLRAISERSGLEVGLEDRLRYQLERPLHHPVTDRGDREDADLAAILRNLPPPCQRHIGAPHEFVLDPLEERFNALRLDGREGHPVYARGTIVVLRQRIRSTQRFHLADVDVQTPETPGRLGLRLDV